MNKTEWRSRLGGAVSSFIGPPASLSCVLRSDPESVGSVMSSWQKKGYCSQFFNQTTLLVGHMLMYMTSCNIMMLLLMMMRIVKYNIVQRFPDCTCVSVPLYMQLVHTWLGTWLGSIQGPRSQMVQLLRYRESAYSNWILHGSGPVILGRYRTGWAAIHKATKQQQLREHSKTNMDAAEGELQSTHEHKL